MDVKGKLKKPDHATYQSAQVELKGGICELAQELLARGQLAPTIGTVDNWH
jgi:hypothetical protein